MSTSKGRFAVDREFVYIENSFLVRSLPNLTANLIMSGYHAFVTSSSLRWEKEHSVVSSFLGVVSPMVRAGSPDALGEQKHLFSLGFSRFEAKHIDFS